VADLESASFERKPESVPAARSVLESFTRPLSSTDRYDASLCLSELVTNAVQHPGHGSGDELRLDLSLTEVVLRVEVRDPGVGFEPGDPTVGDERGWGLFIVDQLASRWGVESGETTLVWFEIDRRDEAADEHRAARRPASAPPDAAGRSVEVSNAIARLRLGGTLTI
jgi:anti-sigma regulatory factor (Ser/Thr protein kinase)